MRSLGFSEIILRNPQLPLDHWVIDIAVKLLSVEKFEGGTIHILFKLFKFNKLRQINFESCFSIFFHQLLLEFLDLSPGIWLLWDGVLILLVVP
jgi:hypothetical protein